MAQNIIKGNELMLFDENGHSLAYATNHTLTLTAETSDTSSKDHGMWGAVEVTKFTYELQSENLFTGGANGTFSTLFQNWVNGTKMKVYFGLKSESNNQATVVDGDYPFWTKNAKNPLYEGTVIITSLSSNANNGENATCSVTFSGCGKFAESNVHRFGFSSVPTAAQTAATWGEADWSEYKIKLVDSEGKFTGSELVYVTTAGVQDAANGLIAFAATASATSGYYYFDFNPSAKIDLLPMPTAYDETTKKTSYFAVKGSLIDPRVFANIAFAVYSGAQYKIKESGVTLDSSITANPLKYKDKSSDNYYYLIGNWATSDGGSCWLDDNLWEGMKVGIAPTSYDELVAYTKSTEGYNVVLKYDTADDSLWAVYYDAGGIEHYSYSISYQSSMATKIVLGGSVVSLYAYKDTDNKIYYSNVQLSSTANTANGVTKLATYVKNAMTNGKEISIIDSSISGQEASAIHLTDGSSESFYRNASSDIPASESITGATEYAWGYATTVIKVGDIVFYKNSSRTLYSWLDGKTHYYYIGTDGTYVTSEKDTYDFDDEADAFSSPALSASTEQGIITSATEMIISTAAAAICTRNSSEDTKYYDGTGAEITLYAWDGDDSEIYYTLVTTGDDVPVWKKGVVTLTGTACKLKKVSDKSTLHYTAILTPRRGSESWSYTS